MSGSLVAGASDNAGIHHGPSGASLIWRQSATMVAAPFSSSSMP